MIFKEEFFFRVKEKVNSLLKEPIQKGHIYFVRRILDTGEPLSNSKHKCFGMESNNIGPQNPIWILLLYYGVDVNFITNGQDFVLFHCRTQEDFLILKNLGAHVNILDNRKRGRV